MGTIPGAAVFRISDPRLPFPLYWRFGIVVLGADHAVALGRGGNIAFGVSYWREPEVIATNPYMLLSSAILVGVAGRYFSNRYDTAAAFRWLNRRVAAQLPVLVGLGARFPFSSISRYGKLELSLAYPT